MANEYTKKAENVLRKAANVAKYTIAPIAIAYALSASQLRGDEAADARAKLTQSIEYSRPVEYAMETPKEVKSSPLEIKAVTDASGKNITPMAVITIGPKYERGFWKGLTDNLIPYRRAKDSANGQSKLFPYWREKPVKCIVETIVEGGLIALAMSGGSGGGSSSSTPTPAPTPQPSQPGNSDGSSHHDNGGSKPAPEPTPTPPPSQGGDL